MTNPELIEEDERYQALLKNKKAKQIFDDKLAEALGKRKIFNASKSVFLAGLRKGNIGTCKACCCG